MYSKEELKYEILRQHLIEIENKLKRLEDERERIIQKQEKIISTLSRKNSQTSESNPISDLKQQSEMN